MFSVFVFKYKYLSLLFKMKNYLSFSLYEKVMNYWDRFGLILLLVVTLAIFGLVIGNASVSGLAVKEIFSKEAVANQQLKSMASFTLVLLSLTIITILATYFIYAKND